MREIVLEARAVTRTYGTGTGATHALRGVDVEIEQGRFTAIIGASGCGKSTLLQILGTLLAPTSGSYLLRGQEVAGMNEKQVSALRRRELGFAVRGWGSCSRHSTCCRSIRCGTTSCCRCCWTNGSRTRNTLPCLPGSWG